MTQNVQMCMLYSPFDVECLFLLSHYSCSWLCCSVGRQLLNALLIPNNPPGLLSQTWAPCKLLNTDDSWPQDVMSPLWDWTGTIVRKVDRVSI